MISNIKGIKGTTVNPKSSNYMNLNWKTCIENGMEIIGTLKHVISTLNMR